MAARSHSKTHVVTSADKRVTIVATANVKRETEGNTTRTTLTRDTTTIAVARR